MERVATFKDRLEQAMEMKKIRPVQLHRLTGISESTISQYRSGYASPKAKNLSIIAKALRVNEAWLLGLDIPPYPELNNDVFFTGDDGSILSMPSETFDVIRAYDGADPGIQKSVRILLGIEK